MPFEKFGSQMILALLGAIVAVYNSPGNEPIVTSSEVEPMVLPTYYQAGLFYAQPITISGDTLRFLTDTGGALYFYSDVAERFFDINAASETPLLQVPFPRFKIGFSIPPPDTHNGLLPLRPRQENDFRDDRDGMLGHVWFRNRIWVLDYKKKRIRYYSPHDMAGVKPINVVSLFHRDQWGEPTHSFPAIDVSVAQDTFRFLFDTGATLVLTDSALSELDDTLPRRRGTSFVVDSIFDRWRRQHPQWRVIEKADKISGEALYGEYEPIIEVPEITIAGQRAGPVWFTRRDEERLLYIVAPMVSGKVQGSLGGSALQYFTIYIDYQKGIAAFQKNR